MITRNYGDLLDVKHGIIVHGCNCLGVMGAGIAAKIARKWPGIEDCYKSFLAQTQPVHKALGKVNWYTVSEELIIGNAMTQLVPGTGKQVSYDALAECFEHVAKLSNTMRLPVHFPLIGCGLAGGKWPIVERIIEESCPSMYGLNLWVLP